MDNSPFIDDFTIKTTIYRGFPSEPRLMTPEDSWVNQLGLWIGQLFFGVYIYMYGGIGCTQLTAGGHHLVES
jgi:hypothetical protein